MEWPKTSPPERIIMGFQLVTVVLLAVGMVATSPMNVAGRQVPPDPLYSYLALALAAASAVATVVFAQRLLGKQGFRVIGREFFAGLMAGGVLGFLVGFALRALFYGWTLWIVTILVLGGAVYFIFWFARRSEGAQPFASV